jgi:hypothetical protein
MFSRCSNWQKNLFDITDNHIFNINEKCDYYSARYQIGVNLIFNDLHVVEIQEYLVTIANKKIFLN